MGGGWVGEQRREVAAPVTGQAAISTLLAIYIRMCICIMQKPTFFFSFSFSTYTIRRNSTNPLPPEKKNMKEGFWGG